MKTDPQKLNFPFQLSIVLPPWSRHSSKRMCKTEEISQRGLNKLKEVQLIFLKLFFTYRLRKLSLIASNFDHYNKNLINLNAHSSTFYFSELPKMTDAHTLQKKSLYDKEVTFKSKVCMKNWVCLVEGVCYNSDFHLKQFPEEESQR